jgi:asparaginyl-tRNA synthetase
MRINEIDIIYEQLIGTDIQIKGLITTIRNQKDIIFININDGTNVSGCQLVGNNTDLKISLGCSIVCNGKVIKSPAKGQKYEIEIINLILIGTCDSESYPLFKSKTSLQYLRNYEHLRFRTKTFGSIFRIRSSLMFATHLFFHDNNYMQLDPNIITLNEAEGGCGAFQLTEKDISNINLLEKKNNLYDWSKDHFTKPVYLTVSSQLQLEAISCALGAVYTMNKSFRAEHSNTTKHVSEFTHLEIENTFIDLDNLLEISEKYIKFVGNYILNHSITDLENLDSFVSKGVLNRIKKLLDNDFIRIEYINAIKLINEKSKIKIVYGDDLNSEAENFITEYYNDTPVFVVNWPLSIKSFYMKQNEDNLTCSNFDLLMPYKIGELIGGSMREDDLDKLVSVMKIKNVSQEPLNFYLDLRKFGTVPHGGFGLGFDRLCQFFCSIENIRDVIPFPNAYQSCKY